ncbi:uncharacterized protein LOC107044301 isoform X2 [Diachasma alloeum]|uniref:uncharacterized protein LOC107044301 isoform X2 n=1 Tax=Diachasma alloeum TaxID=454923 RepID=UPI0007383031|nr:uncharacterized protein LOC107044301 isoform X2 [Diachasma alloeum]
MRRLQEMKDKSDLFDSKSSEKENQSERDEKPCCDEFKKPWAKRKVGSLVIEGKAHRLYWGSNAIGRTHHNSIQLQSMKVSKRQAVIVATDNKMLIWPISRKSPTCVNSIVLPRKKWCRIYDLFTVSFGDVKGYVRNEKNRIARKNYMRKKKEEKPAAT